ncbi:hypothetical protein AB5J62_15970 [Amycolatopsis sp. cg5]|uniref:phthiocerol/phthiodiolone dimycocerosyl transferase family protein n=1 Tax=Amycolatopsis sp. cg5 TaxID=3238802 RepID=UPI0035254088
MSLRELSRTETALVGVRITCLSTVHGGLDEGLLMKALDMVVTADPVLPARIGGGGTGYHLYLPDAEPPSLRRGIGSLYAELDVPIGPGDPLLRAVLFRGEEEDTFVLGAAHALFGRHGLTELSETIWRVYTALADGTEVPTIVPGPRLPDTFAGQGNRVTQRGRKLPFDRGGKPGVETQRILVQPKTTRRLAEVAKAANTSVPSLVGAATLLAVRDVLTPHSGALPLCFASTAGLCFTDVSPDLDPLALARRIAGGTPVPDQLIAEVATVRLSDFGSVSAPAMPDGVELTDLQVHVSPRWTPSGQGCLPFGMLVVDGRLDLSIAYRTECFGAESIRQVLDGTYAVLDQVSSARDSR